MRSPIFDWSSTYQVGGDDGELRLVEEGGERAFAVVEFVVADGHDVNASCR